MPAVITQQPNEPIWVVKVSRPFDPVVHPREVAQHLAAAMPTFDSPVWYRILDFTNFEVNFSELMLAMGYERDGTPGTFSDPRTRTIYVSDSEIFRFSARSAEQGQYGGAKVSIFATVEEALAH